MPWLIGTAAQARNAITRINNALGLPRTATEADRAGGGIHVPLAQVPVVQRWAFIARLSDGTIGVRIKARIYNHMTAAQQALVVADLPDGVEITREDED
jgi:hypothetical protein